MNNAAQYDRDGFLVVGNLYSIDAVFFSELAIHASHPNTSGADRWSLISTYRDASVKDDSTVWKIAMVVSGKIVNV